MENIDSFQEIMRWTQSSDPVEHAVEWIKQNLKNWFLWDAREELGCLGHQGLYLIAMSHRPDMNDVVGKWVVCIGETHAQDLRYRLRQFDRSAFEKSEDHGPGSRLRKACGKLSREKFYVSVLPLNLDEPWKSLVPPFLEGILHWNYTKVRGDLPFANRHPNNKKVFGPHASCPDRLSCQC